MVTILFLLLLIPVWSAEIDDAYRLYNQGEYRKSAAILETLRDRGELDASYIALLGMCYLQMGDLDAGRQAIGMAERVDPDNYTVMLARGNLLLFEGKYQEAEEIFKRAQELFPYRLEARNGRAASIAGRALALMRSGEYERSAEEAEQAWNLQPENEQILSVWIAALRHTDRKEKLRLAYQHYLELQPNSPEANAGMGLILNAEGLQEKARIYLQKAIDLDTADPEPYLILGKKAARGGQIVPARTLLQEAVGKSVQLYNMYRLQAANQIDENEARDAEGLKRLKTLSSQAERPRGILRESIDALVDLYPDKEELLKELRRLADWYSSTAEVRIALAEQLTAAGHLQEARQVWEKLIEDFSLMYRAHLGLSRCYYKERNMTRAALSARRALDLNPEEEEVYTLLKSIYKEMNKPEIYLQVLEMQLLKDTYNPLLYSQAADAAEDIGRSDTAELYRSRAEQLRQGNY